MDKISTSKEEHIQWLRSIVIKADLGNYDLFVKWFESRFPEERCEHYVLEWVRRFQSGDPIRYMDSHSKRLYLNVLNNRGVV